MRVPESVLLLRSQPRREEVVVGLARGDLPRVGSTTRTRGAAAGASICASTASRGAAWASPAARSGLMRSMSAPVCKSTSEDFAVKF